MNSREAARLLNIMRYKPGTSTTFWPEGEDGVGMSLQFTAYDSTPDIIDGGYGRETRIQAPPISFSVRGLDAEQVMAAGLRACIEVDIHEAREFWRVGKGGPAPFHPHNMQGEAAWTRCRDAKVSVRYPQPANPKPVLPTSLRSGAANAA